MKKKPLLSKALRTAFFAGVLLFSCPVLFAQVKIGTNPTVIEPASNLEVEASTTGRKTKVDKTTGQVTIADGTEGAGKILTSDAAGGASWQAPGNLQIDKTVFIGRQSGEYLITTWSGTFNDIKDRIPMTVTAGSSPGYDPATKAYIIQQSGNYRVYSGAHMVGTLAPPQLTDVTVRLAPWQVINVYENINTVVGPVLSVFWEAYIPAGTAIFLYVTSSPNGGGAQNVKVSDGFCTIVKLAY
jgi:hypothetical protein